MASYWNCKACGARNVRTRSARCALCGEATKPAKRARKHAAVLQGDSYPLFVRAAELIHLVTDESCCVCGKAKPPNRRWDRDHDHVTGNPRGLACGGNQGCNMLILPWVTPLVALAIANAMQYEGSVGRLRWRKVYRYLDRVDAFYKEGGVIA